MKKRNYIFLLLIILFQNSCNNSSTPDSNMNPGNIIFEVNYVNFAWGYHCDGFYIDSLGNCYTFERPRDSVFKTQSEDTISIKDLQNKWKFSDSLYKQIPKNTINQYTSLTADAIKGKLPNGIMKCADAGTTYYAVYVFNKDLNKFIRFILYQGGDIYRENPTKEANEIVTWLKSINPKYAKAPCE
jgi:hypothetical protein